MQRQKRVDYYALDVTSSEISRSLEALSSLVQKSSLIKCHGLLGSYDDLIPWLTRNDQLVGRKVTFLWLGNSIANLTRKLSSSGPLYFVGYKKYDKTRHRLKDLSHVNFIALGMR